MTHSSLAANALQEIVTQRRVLRSRIEASGLYLNEVEEFEVAVQAYAQLLGRLDIDNDLGSLATSESRNLIRRVKLKDGRLGVLKVIGNTREPGEGELLAAWHRAGLPSVKPITWGYVRVRGEGSSGTAMYLLTEYVEADQLPEPTTPSQRRDRVRELIALVRPFHTAHIRVSRSRTWEDRLRQHLHWTVPVLRNNDASLPKAWPDKLDLLSREGRIVIHGDPAGSNVLESSEGLVLIDPPGALTALAEADIAQICCQVGGVDATRDLIDLACTQDPSLDPSAIAAFAGLNFLIWAGYMLAQHSNPDARRSSRSPGTTREQAERYLWLADTFLAEYHLP